VIGNLIFISLLLAACCCSSVDKTGELFVTNHAIDKFDIVLMTVTIGDIIVYKDTVTNKYLSHHWDKKSFLIPSDSFRVSVNILGQRFNIRKDTVLQPGGDRKQMFITFSFYPYYKRYYNPEIYSHVDTGMFDVKKVADSLYNNKILKNADSYLNDTIPLPADIGILFKKPEKQVL
jgi:hypothetical protein